MASIDERHSLFLRLLALPGAVRPTIWDDVEWAWGADPYEPLYIDRLQAIQSTGVYPDSEAHLVRFNAALLVRSFPQLRPHFTDIQALRPMTFNGRQPNRPRPSLRLVVA